MAIAALVGPEGVADGAAAALGCALPFHGTGDVHIGDAWFRGVATFADKGPQPDLAQAADGRCVLCVARFDSRPELAAALRAGDGTRNAELLLLAHARWGARLVEHLSGDFCFLLWDPRERALLAATDPFGARPIFYRQDRQTLAIANALSGLRDGLAGEAPLDEAALAQWLAVGMILDPEATMVTDIRRLPAAHLLEWRDGKARLSRYWSPPVDQPFDYRPRAALAEDFRHLFLRAVGDRLPAEGPIGILLSGGMDSAAIAAATRQLLPPDEAAARITGYTVTFRDFPEAEGDYAAMVARHLGIRQTVITAEDSLQRATIERRPFHRDEPSYDPGLSPPSRAVQAVAASGGVLLSGVGADPMFVERGSALLALAARERWRTPVAMARTRMLYGSLPILGLRGLATRVRPSDVVPDWLAPEFVQRTALLDCIADHQRTVRADAAGRLTGIRWTNLLAMGAASQSRRTLESACPFFDTRLLAFALRLPEPAMRRKQVLRDAMAPWLPRKVIARPKTSLGLATLAQLTMPAVQTRILGAMAQVPAVEAYVDPAAFRARLAAPRPADAFKIMAAEAVFQWLARMREEDR